MRVRFTSALVAALTACVLLPATSSAAPASQGCDDSHHSDTGHGANQGGPYDNTCDGSPSGNGNGNGEATGKPCAGCVGNADDKNPGAASGKGQYPNGSDHNAGYECDRNHGIGRTNPAHTGCRTQTTVNPPPQTCPNGSPMPPSGKCDQGGSQTCPNGSPMPPSGNCGNTETPPITTSTTQPPPEQAVLGERAEGNNAPASTPKSTTPVNDQQEVLGENAAGDESPESASPPAPAQATHRENASSNNPLPFTGTDLIVVLLAAGIALAGGIALRRLATHQM
jgi:hypothetical protein